MLAVVGISYSISLVKTNKMHCIIVSVRHLEYSLLIGLFSIAVICAMPTSTSNSGMTKNSKTVLQSLPWQPVTKDGKEEIHMYYGTNWIFLQIPTSLSAICLIVWYA